MSAAAQTTPAPAADEAAKNAAAAFDVALSE